MDPITRTLQILVDYIGIKVDVKFWSQHVSFLVIGIIVLTSIRGLLINLTKVCNRTDYLVRSPAAGRVVHQLVRFFSLVIVFLRNLKLQIVQHYSSCSRRADGHVLCFNDSSDAHEYASTISHYHHPSTW